MHEAFLPAFVCTGFGDCKMFAHCAGRMRLQIPLPPEHGRAEKAGEFDSRLDQLFFSKFTFFFLTISLRLLNQQSQSNAPHELFQCPQDLLCHMREAHVSRSNYRFTRRRWSSKQWKIWKFSDCNGNWNAPLLREVILMPSSLPKRYKATPVRFSGVFYHVLI